MLTDGGGLYAVLNEVTAPNRAADSTLRIIANYACELADNGDTTGVLLYSASTVVSPSWRASSKIQSLKASNIWPS